MISPEHEELRAALRRWAETEIAPYAAETDETATFPRNCFESYVKNGWVGMQYPAEHGGEGADWLSNAILVEEVARACASSSVFVLISKLGTIPLIHFGSEDLKSRYLPAVARGESQFSYCLSEADAGSDVASMKARAVRDGDHYVLNGSKYWITNAGVSDVYTVFAKTDSAAGSRGMSCFVVEEGWGVQVGKLEKKMGIRGSPTAEVILEDVRVPVANRIGEEGDGFKIAMGTLDRSRPAVGAQAVGIAQGALDCALEYLTERRQFGRPLIDNQGLQFMVADMAMRLEAARLLVYEACATLDARDAGDTSRDISKIGAMAKCFAGDAAMSVTTDAVQLLGGYGYTQDFPVERMMRDAKITQIYEGTNQIQRLVIARRLLAERK